MTTLAPVSTAGTYEFQVTDLLHDPAFAKWSQASIDTYINPARKQLVMDTGCLRSLQVAYLTAGIEQYFFGSVTGSLILTGGSGYVNPSVSFSGGGGTGAAATVQQSGGSVTGLTFTNFGSGYTSAPNANITDAGPGVGATAAIGVINVNTFDVLDIHVLWGTQRYTLDWFPFRKFSAQFRPWTAASFQRQPVCWAVYGETSLFIGPTPDQNYTTEFDSVVLPTPFAVNDTTTVDAIPIVAQDPIQFYAAYLAKNNAQSFGEAEGFLAQYRRRVAEVNSAYTGRIMSQYDPGEFQG